MECYFDVITEKSHTLAEKSQISLTDFEKLENNIMATKKCSTALAIQVKTTSISSTNANLPVKKHALVEIALVETTLVETTLVEKTSGNHNRRND